MFYQTPSWLNTNRASWSWAWPGPISTIFCFIFRLSLSRQRLASDAVIRLGKQEACVKRRRQWQRWFWSRWFSSAYVLSFCLSLSSFCAHCFLWFSLPLLFVRLLFSSGFLERKERRRWWCRFSLVVFYSGSFFFFCFFFCFLGFFLFCSFSTPPLFLFFFISVFLSVCFFSPSVPVPFFYLRLEGRLFMPPEMRHVPWGIVGIVVHDHTGFPIG